MQNLLTGKPAGNSDPQDPMTADEHLAAMRRLLHHASGDNHNAAPRQDRPGQDQTTRRRRAVKAHLVYAAIALALAALCLVVLIATGQLN